MPASNTVGGVAETQTVVRCDMLSKGHNSAIITLIKILFPLRTCSMHVWTVLQVSNACIIYCRRSFGNKNSTTKSDGQTDGSANRQE